MRRLTALALAALAATALPAAAQRVERLEQPSKRPMTFRVVADNPSLPEAHQKRWIAASGSIIPETATAFEWFLKGNNLDGMTIFFDSPGGSIVGGMRLGETLRKHNARVSIGRTTPLGPQKKDEAVRHELLPARGICYSSCAYAFLGGRTRLVPRGAGFGVHMFWPGDQMEGLLTRSYAYADIERAQRISANLAAYIQRMGGDQQLLQLAAAAPPRGAMRRLSPREILALKVGSLEFSPPVLGGAGHWGVAVDQWRARLVNGGEWRTPQGIDITYSIEASCNDISTFHDIRFEMAPKTEPPPQSPLALRRVLLTSGNHEGVLAYSSKDPLPAPASFPRRISQKPDAWIGAAGEIMPEVLNSAALPAAAPLVLRIEDGENPRLDLPLPQGNLPQVYERFAAACARLAKGQTAIP